MQRWSPLATLAGGRYGLAMKYVGLIGLSLVLSACGGSAPAAPPPETPPPPPAETAAPEPPPEPEATAEPEAEPPPAPVTVTIEPKSKSKLKGTATLEQTADGVKITIDVENAKPGMHAWHVHENGDCSAPDGKSAGGHFNPDKHDHGLPTADARHLGDLGNLEVGKDGKGHTEITIPGANLKKDDPHSYLGRAIIIHEKKDDGGQPTGNAGGRIGCGVIGG